MGNKVKAYLKTNDGEVIASTVIHDIAELSEEQIRKKANEHFERYGYFIGTKKSVVIEEVN